MIFKRSISLLEEIIERRTRLSGVIGKIIMFIFGFLFAPILILVLLRNDNDYMVRQVVTTMLDYYEQEDE